MAIKLGVKTKTLLGGLAAGTILIVSIIFTSSGGIKICWNTPPKCQTFTQAQYSLFKQNLFAKRESGQPLSLDEYYAIIAVYNFEIGKRGGLTLSSSTKDNVLSNLEAIIK